MYINRKGIAEKKGIRKTLKDMFFDIESILYVMAADTVDIFYDIYEDVIDLRWDLFVYRMRKRGLISSDMPAGASASIMGIIFR